MHLTATKFTKGVVTVGVAALLTLSSSVFNATKVFAYSAANVHHLAQAANGQGNGDPTLFVKFQYKMYFDNVSRAELYEFTKEIPNDDLWCNCSTTTVIAEGVGSRQLGRQWFQQYSFAGLQDQITYTRLHLEENEQHSWEGEGLFADIVSDYRFTDLSNGGTLLTFDAIYKPNVPVVEPQIAYILEALRVSYETEFITYFGSTGHVDLTTMEFTYL
jgi:hypothetical protein